MRVLEHFEENLNINSNDSNFLYRCKKCQLVKKNEDFPKRNNRSNIKRKYYSWCKLCYAERTKINREKKENFRKCVHCNLLKEHTKSGYICKDCYRKYIKNNKDAIKNTILKRKYGISLPTYFKMFEDQEGKCKICKVKLNSGIYNENGMIDHCHATGKVRGILCHLCNIGLGAFKDNIEVLEKAIQYLNNYVKDSRS
jgi:hypothetical protein